MDKLNNFFNKIMPIIMPIGVITGLLLPTIFNVFSPYVAYLFAFVTLQGSLKLNMKSLLAQISAIKLILFFFFMFHIASPLLAFFITKYIFQFNLDIVTGFVLLFSINTAVSSTVWADIYKGKMSLTLAIIIIDSVISPIIVPLMLQFTIGQSIDLDVLNLIKSLCIMVVIPFFIGVLLNKLLKEKVINSLNKNTKPLSKIILFIVVAANVAKISDMTSDINFSHIYIILAFIFFITSFFFLMFFISRKMKIDYQRTVTLCFNYSLRNISVALVLAIEYFSSQTALTIVFSVFVQHTLVALLASFAFNKLYINPNLG